jgi:hypothetical protein
MYAYENQEIYRAIGKWPKSVSSVSGVVVKTEIGNGKVQKSGRLLVTLNRQTLGATAQRGC